MPRGRGPSVRDIRSGPSPLAPRSPLWIDDGAMEAAPAQLNLDCGNKTSMARSVAISPQRYSSSFASQVDRFSRSEYYRANDPRQRAAKQRSPHAFYDAQEQQPHIDVKDPARQHTVFQSAVERFPDDHPDIPPSFRRGMHPQMKKAAPSFAVDESKHLEADHRRWTRNGFFHPRGPRLPVSPRPITADLQAADLTNAGEHVDAMHLSLAQSVQVSPRKLRVMTSRSDRFTTPGTYVANEPRNVLAIKPQYDNDLGPGSYDAASGAIVIPRPGKLQGNFASGSPRLPKDHPPTSGVGSNTASVEHDQRSWTAPRIWTSKAHAGRSVHGAQIGSYELMEGLGRSASPHKRSPDVTYSLDHSAQKRPLSEDMLASKMRYSMPFRSQSPRLEKSKDEKRSIAYPRGAVDQFDLSASAAYPSHLSASVFSSDGSTLSGTHHSAPFASETARFPPTRTLSKTDVDLVEADRKKWHARGQPLTTHSERPTPFTEGSKATPGHYHLLGGSPVPSPGPGTYINPRVWDSQHKASPGSSTPREA